jgi:endonuclease YncB( thermonuclease family)
MRIILFYLLMSFGFLFLSPAHADIPGKPDIIDGNTILIAGEPIRLYGIDAPELMQTCERQDGKNWQCGKEAMYALLRFLENHWVTCKDERIDSSGSKSMICFAGPYDVSAKMVQDGWAMVLDQERPDFLLYQQDSVVAKRGIWQGKVMNPWDWRRSNYSK